VYGTARKNPEIITQIFGAVSNKTRTAIPWIAGKREHSMNTRRYRQRTVRYLAAVSSLTLAIGLQAFAESPIEQPISVATMPAVELDPRVALAGCTDSRCGDETAEGKAVCCPKRVTKEEKKHCWNVKSERICIPRFRFQCNWKKHSKNCDCGDTCYSNRGDCPPKGGRVRCIKVLEKHEYTCEECSYAWEVKYVRTGKGCCRSSGQDCPLCGCASTKANP